MEEKAKALQARALKVLASPGALMIPKDARNLIADLVALVVELAGKVEK